ncbi:two-component sensor histidine kinase [Cellvibrio zantedeschiae]|uniref:histidine kinase n=1 Tax=Cellvibrio zantedeschiae TaxID=1237077 RepID=A0ABQ3B7X8_9GAMM|nr:ATP-binding protein [Cellvibrio zantedeschiae]GGY84076.1 two-component sensor histidine kinase [Cellvibrio zantedeschiae]
MNRAFVSLYLIIVLSILLLGLVLNKFWDDINPPQAVDTAVVDLFSLIEQSLEADSGKDKQALLHKAIAQLKYKVSLISVTDFSRTTMAEKIKRGEIVSATDEHTNYFYKRVANTDDVLMLSYPSELNKRSEFYIAFILLFYAAIAGVVFLWVWPLTRDLARLSQHAQQMGGEGQATTIAISSRSVLYPFAKVFNAMAKRLDEILRSQKEMTLAVSHELRTPLARMKFALAITEEQNLPANLARQLSSINRDILEMESLINSFLAYAAFDQQSQRLNQREGHIQDLVQDIIHRLANHLDDQVRIEVVDKTEGAAMKCEWSLMQTAIQNLIHNASGYAKSIIRITLQVNSNDFVIAVEDDGPGVPEDQRNRIFESFVRIYSELPNRSGFGLGLALVKRIMDWHLGSAVCSHSDLGGAKFLLKWPR